MTDSPAIDTRPVILARMTIDGDVSWTEPNPALGLTVDWSKVYPAEEALKAAERVAAEPAPLFPCLMTDIETLSLHTGNAFLLSQGAVPYRLTPEGPVMGPPLLLVFDPFEQLLSTRHIDDKTRQFWRDQPTAAQAHFRDPAYVGHGGVTPQRTTMGELAGRLKAFQAKHCTPKNEIYSQGITFDLANLASAMADSGHAAPWEYWAATDCRSLRRKLTKRREAPKLDIAGAAHDPVFDCVKQIWSLWEVATDDMLGVVPQAVAA